MHFYVGYSASKFFVKHYLLYIPSRYTTTNKLITLDDLAAFTNMKSKTVVLWLNRMVEMGMIDGVVDDRGRFIQVTREELDNLAIFIKLRGRTKITDILATSNRLFNFKEE